MVILTINGEDVEVTDSEMPLLWAIRETAGLTGTKFTCGKGLCGACTVHLDGQPVRSCVVPSKIAAGRVISTIEGVSQTRKHTLIQRAWVAESVPQCGYCQSGQIMSALAFLERNPNPSDEEISSNMNVLCRCGTYPRISAAIRRAAHLIATDTGTTER
jgi:isoquinoline 1-oxidoreductase subunit alpha